MLSEKRKSELAGFSREEWEWEQGADARIKSDVAFMANAALVERIPIPPKSEKRIRVETSLKSAFPDLGEPAILYLISPNTLVFVGAGVNGHRIRTWGIRRGPNRVPMPDSPQIRALNDFLASGLDWVQI